MSNGAVRLAHLSDIHVMAPITERPWRWPAEDWFTKRVTGWSNLYWRGRARHFQQADQVLEALTEALRSSRRPNHIVLSGDATALGFPEELRRAARMLGVGNADMPPGLAVPGNHDYYLPGDAASGRFERCFAPWQHGERIDGEPYPFAQKVGPLWLIAVNSCQGHYGPTNASGRVGSRQCDRLGRLLRHLDGGPRILVTHYPVCRKDGQAEPRMHGLSDLAQVVRVAADGGIGLWLHGHNHRWYHHQRPYAAPFPVICVGSSTQLDLWGYHEYVVEGSRLSASRREFDPAAKSFREIAAFEVKLSFG